MNMLLRKQNDMDGRTDKVKTVSPPQTKFVGGIMMYNVAFHQGLFAKIKTIFMDRNISLFRSFDL